MLPPLASFPHAAWECSCGALRSRQECCRRPEKRSEALMHGLHLSRSHCFKIFTLRASPSLQWSKCVAPPYFLGAARLFCIPTRRVGTSEKCKPRNEGCRNVGLRRKKLRLTRSGSGHAAWFYSERFQDCRRHVHTRSGREWNDCDTLSIDRHLWCSRHG